MVSLTLKWSRFSPDKPDFVHSLCKQGNYVARDSGGCHRCLKWQYSHLVGPPGPSGICENCQYTIDRHACKQAFLTVVTCFTHHMTFLEHNTVKSGW